MIIVNQKMMIWNHLYINQQFLIMITKQEIEEIVNKNMIINNNQYNNQPIKMMIIIKWKNQIKKLINKTKLILIIK